MVRTFALNLNELYSYGRMFSRGRCFRITKLLEKRVIIRDKDFVVIKFCHSIHYVNSVILFTTKQLFAKTVSVGVVYQKTGIFAILNGLSAIYSD